MFARSDSRLLARWWWTVDRWALGVLIFLLALGLLLSFAGTPVIARRLGMEMFHMVEKQLALFLPTLGLMIGISVLPVPKIQRVCIFLFIVSYLLLCLTPWFGIEIKGARRWMNFGGLSLQASEFIKPAFCVLSAWIFSLPQYQHSPWKIRLLSAFLYLMVIIPILAQPDLGMAVVITAVWIVQLFISGLPLIWVGTAGIFGALGLISAYFFFPHVQSRIDRFLDPQAGDHYQILKSITAFQEGGLWGRGPGEGIVKKHLPDAHSDFIFAVAGEEFGLFLCLLIVMAYAFILFRTLWRTFEKKNFFIILASFSLAVQFCLQAAINMASSLHLIPTKGMTLPFLSYGGSSLLAIGIGMGLLLGLTREHSS